MNKKEWLKLAEAFIAESGYWSDLYESKIKVAERYGLGTDFIGNDYFDGPVTSAIGDVLGEDFCYWLYDCDRNFNEFNKKVTLADNRHPAIHSLEDLYNFSQGIN